LDNPVKMDDLGVPPFQETTIWGIKPLGFEGNHVFRQTHVYYPLVMTNIAMENGPFIDGLPGLPIKNGDFPWLC